MSGEEPPKRERYVYSERDLLKMVSDQAITGGYKDETLSPGGNGPYWSREGWKLFCSGIKTKLIEDCGYDDAKADQAIQENSTGVIIVDVQED